MKLRTVLVLLALVSFASATGAQSRPDSIYGRVVTDSGVALAGATVSVTRGPDRAFQTAVTDSKGTFRIIFAEGTGDYLIHAALTGYKSARQRVIRNNDEPIPEITLKLASSVQQLATVEVKSSKPIPQRGQGIELEIGEAARLADGVIGAVPPGLAGNLDAIALTMPGINSVNSGISAFGLGPSTNENTLNGMSFAGNALPRDARTTTRVGTSTYDPSRGWFAGAQTSVELDQGNLFSSRSAHITADAPILQYGGLASSGSSSQFSNLQFSTGGDGSFSGDKMGYNFGLQGGTRRSDVRPFERASAALLRDAGIAPPVATDLLAALATKRIPLNPGSSPLGAVENNFSFVGRIDHAPYNWTTFEAAKTTYGIVGFGSLNTASNAGVTPYSTSLVSGTNRQLSIGAQALYSSYLKKNYLNDVRSTVSLENDTHRSATSLPGAVIQLRSTEEEGDALFVPVLAGGQGGSGSRQRTFRWETLGQTEFYWSEKSTHHARIAADARFDSFRNADGNNTVGTFFYNSLEDFAADKPAEFNRRLGSTGASASEWNGFVSASDSWRVVKNFRLLYGARLEGNRYLNAPTFNSALFDAFGVRNDHLPNTMHISPRAGFTWSLSNPSAGRKFTPLGNFYFSDAKYLRGGIGEFRNILPVSLATDIVNRTGLQTGTNGIRCIGPSAPTAPWDSSFVGQDDTDACADGSSGSTFSDLAPGAALYDRNYSAQRSWRANLGYSSRYHRVTYTIDGNYSIGLGIPQIENLNFLNVARFISKEGRDVFVPVSAIDPRTGIPAASASRLNSSFGNVIAHGSTGRIFARQVSITVSPQFETHPQYSLSMSYTLASSRARLNGFTAPTFGSPTASETVRSDYDSRHQVLVQGGLLYRGFALTLFSRIQSGTPFTPIVSSDVNGDGFNNDRAFVFDVASDAALGASTKSMLESAPARIRNCLERQLNHAADRNSCEGPWTASLNAQITSQRELPLLRRRGRIALAFANPLGGLDRLIHGSDGIRGWGAYAEPDPKLYFVRGFDPSRSRFIYEVNPGFGRNQSIGRPLRSPFRVTLDVTLDVGKPMAVQQIERWLKPGRGGNAGARLSAADLKKRYSRTVNNPYKAILNESDSLLLSRKQAEAIQKIEVEYRAGIDSIWTTMSEKLAAMPDHFDAKAALAIQEDATDRAWEFTRLHVKSNLGNLLDPLQINLSPARWLYRSEKPFKVRMYMN
jgi:hypothetical protein